MSNGIPLAELPKGIKLHFENMDSLVESANLLYQNKKYLLSACLSIYAYEESVKTKFLIDNFQKRTDISDEEWRRWTVGGKAHKNKLREFMKEEAIFVLYTAFEEGMNREKLRNQISDFYHALKTHVLYVNWDKDEKSNKWQWRWFPQEYTEELQKQTAGYLLATAKRSCERLKKKVEP